MEPESLDTSLMSSLSQESAAPCVSVVICTLNRSAALQLTLQALSEMRIPDELAWEVLVVDNGSTDDTGEVLRSFDTKLPLRRLFHPTPGQSRARNVGLRAATGSIIAWTDDDCIVDTEWLATLWSTFQNNPAVAGVGGRVELYNPADWPLTLQRNRQHATLGRNGRFSRDDVFMLPGCNMAFRSSIYPVIGEFDPKLGPGSKAQSSDDTDFLYRVLRAGNALAYAPEVLVYHNHGRRTPESAEQLLRGYAVGRGAFICKHLLRGDAYIFRILGGEVMRCLRPMVQVTVRHSKWLWYVATGALFRLLGR